jgi:hypothetical protein
MPKFVRVRDKDTGHQFDVPEADSRIGEAFDLVKGVDPVDGYLVQAREPKHNVDKAGKPAAPSRTTAQEG